MNSLSRKSSGLGLLALLVILVTLETKSEAANTLIANFATGSFNIDSSSTSSNTGSANPTQSSSGITMNGASALADTFYGAFTGSGVPFNLSSYTGFNLLMTLSGTNPNLPFIVALVNSDFSAAYFEATTVGIGSSPTSVALTYTPISGSNTSIALGSLNDVTYMQFTWAGGGTVNTTLVSLEAIPEPSTGALLMIGAVGMVALRRLRKV